MNILYTITRYWPAIGGAETHVRQVGHELSSSHGIQVFAHTGEQLVDPVRVSTVETPSESKVYQDGKTTVNHAHASFLERIQLKAAAKLYHQPRTRNIGYRNYAAVFAPQLAELISIHEIDVIHNVLVGTEYLSQLSLQAARAAGLPFVITPLVHEGIWGDSDYLFKVYREADAVIALLEVEQALYLRNGVPEARTHTIGVSPVIDEKGDGEAFRRKHNINGPMVLFVGRQVRSKGYAELLEAAPSVWNRHPHVSLVFIGPSEEEPYHTAHDGDNRVLRLGSVSDTEKCDALNACDIFCLPSVSEIMPTAILEAWYFGKPVVGGAIPALEELIEDGKCGLIVDQNPRSISVALEGLLDDPEHARQMGENGRKKVMARYTTERVAYRLEGLYQSLCHEQ